MPAYSWLIIGSIVGFVARSVIGGKAYGTLTDALLGITGAFLASWILKLPSVDVRTSWAGKSVLMIWAAVALLFLVRFIAKRKTLTLQSKPQTQLSSLERRSVGFTVHNQYLPTSNNAGRAVLPFSLSDRP
jgi:uncharacterized membrane protein YeaQ/YmgE (transglycosylase-associated protein family)